MTSSDNDFPTTSEQNKDFSMICGAKQKALAPSFLGYTYLAEVIEVSKHEISPRSSLSGTILGAC